MYVFVFSHIQLLCTYYFSLWLYTLLILLFVLCIFKSFGPNKLNTRCTSTFPQWCIINFSWNGFQPKNVSFPSLFQRVNWSTTPPDCNFLFLSILFGLFISLCLSETSYGLPSVLPPIQMHYRMLYQLVLDFSGNEPSKIGGVPTTFRRPSTTKVSWKCFIGYIIEWFSIQILSHYCFLSHSQLSLLKKLIIFLSQILKL